MIKKIIKALLLILIILTGLLFISDIKLIGNTHAAVKMHSDLPRNASAMAANAKVIICFITGVLFIFAALAVFDRSYRGALSGIIGCILFDGFYLAEVILWGKINPHIWFGFFFFGSLCLFIGLFSLYYFLKGKKPKRLR
jgi:hypothetical protein